MERLVWTRACSHPPNQLALIHSTNWLQTASQQSMQLRAAPSTCQGLIHTSSTLVSHCHAVTLRLLPWNAPYQQIPHTVARPPPL
eukprot:365603-Chlamydomonas_euryale.AAC.5